METPHVGRVVERRRGLDGVIDGIASLPRSDRTSILMAAMGEAAPAVTASAVLDRHHEDRFVRPGTVDHDLLADTQHRLLAALGGRTERIVVAPLVPFGTHHALGGTPQDNVVTTVRATEVAADPTIGLALEAAARRRVLLADDERTADRVDLATVQRVTRAQRFEGPTSFAHFTLAGRVTAGRDTGNGDFEVETISDHIDGWRRGLAECGLDGVEITVSDFCGRHTPILDRILARVGDGHRDVHRTQGQGYYDDLCLSLDVVADGTRHDIGDGGRVTWAAAHALESEGTAAHLGSRRRPRRPAAKGIGRVHHVTPTEMVGDSAAVARAVPAGEVPDVAFARPTPCANTDAPRTGRTVRPGVA